MKKILSGMFFRLIKGFEIWALLSLAIIGSLYLDYAQMYDEECLTLIHSDHTVDASTEDQQLYINAGNVKEYRFEGMGISSYDAFRKEAERLPDDVDKKISGTVNYLSDELRILFTVLGISHILPSALIILFIPLFFGRMFSDGTIKNLIACGHSKGQIYLSSLILTVMLDLLMLVINILAFVFWCFYYEWKPPVYLPVVVLMLVCVVLVLFTISSISLAVLFISSKKTAVFIVGFVFVVFTSIQGNVFLFAALKPIDTGDKFIEYRTVISEHGWNAVEQRFDLSEFSINEYYNGKDISPW